MTPGDLAERLPLFDNYAHAATNIDTRTFDNINPAVTESMKNCIPVGLRSDNTLDIPKSYEPQDGPLVLMLHEGEDARIRWSEGMEKMVKHTFRFSGVDIDSISPVEDFKTSSAIGAISSRHMHQEASQTSLFVPCFVTLRPQRFEPDRVITLAHEADHWDFFLNEAPILHAQGMAFSYDEARSLAEKRAYTTQYTINSQRGAHAVFMPAEELAKHLKGETPELAAQKVLRLMKLYWDYNKMSCPYPTEVGVVALSLCFADKDPSVRINEDEIRAYRAFDVVA